MRMPLLIVDPSTPSALRGGRTSALASSLDYFPTICDFVGVGLPEYQLNGIPADFTGRSLLPVVAGASPAVHDAVFGSHLLHEVYQYYPMRAMVTPSHKLIHNLLGPGVAFPTAGDVFGSPTHQQLLAGHRPVDGQRAGFLAASRPPGSDGRTWAAGMDGYLHRAEWELYDLGHDPRELRNLAGVPEHAALLAELQEKLVAWQEQTGDVWRYRENGGPQTGSRGGV
jgi:N-sulfoglucosamine sulfohydrolase